MTEEDWRAWCDSQADQDEPPDPDEEEPDSAAPWEYDLDAIVATARQAAADEAAASALKVQRWADGQGHAIGHGCARPEPKTRAKRRKPGPRDGRDPPGRTGDPAGPRFAFTATGQHGPPEGYGTWTLRTGIGGQRDLLVALDPIATGDCDHRFEAKGHDPGVKLRHLAQIRHAMCTDLPTARHTM